MRGILKNEEIYVLNQIKVAYIMQHTQTIIDIKTS